MIRRVISLGLCLGLLALGSASLSACAMVVSLPGECASPAAQGNCEAMQHAEEPIAISSGGDLACCWLAAPAPDAVTLSKEAPLPHLSVASIDLKLASVEGPRIDFFTADLPLASPHHQQSRLCVFLI
jgi:hypothetical protein